MKVKHVRLSFFSPFRVRKMQNLISEHNKSAHTGLENYPMYHSANLWIQTPANLFYLAGPVGGYTSDGEIMELLCPLLWPAKMEGDNYSCLNCFHSNTPLLGFLFFCVIWRWGGCKENEPVLHPVIPADTFIAFDKKCTDTERSNKDDCGKMSMGMYGWFYFWSTFSCMKVNVLIYKWQNKNMRT